MDCLSKVPVGGVSAECRPVFELLDALGWFRLTDGEAWPPSRPWKPQTPRVKEIVEHLASAELRPALRAWYCRLDHVGPEHLSDQMREALGKLVGEKL